MFPEHSTVPYKAGNLLASWRPSAPQVRLCILLLGQKTRQKRLNHNPLEYSLGCDIIVTRLCFTLRFLSAIQAFHVTWIRPAGSQSLKTKAGSSPVLKPVQSINSTQIFRFEALTAVLLRICGQSSAQQDPPQRPTPLTERHKAAFLKLFIGTNYLLNTNCSSFIVTTNCLPDEIFPNRLWKKQPTINGGLFCGNKLSLNESSLLTPI